MSNDLRERLDASFGSGPQHPPIAQTLVSGRRALRRRRLATAAGAATVVVAAVLAPWALNASDSSAPPVTPPTQTPYTPPPVAQPLDLPVDTSWQSECGTGGAASCEDYLIEEGWFTYSDGGTLARRSPDVAVWEVVGSPLDLPGGASAAVEANYAGMTHWWLVALLPDGRVVTREFNPGGYDGGGLADWGEEMAALAKEQGRPVPRP